MSTHKANRPRGTGSLYTHANADGSETYYGKWRVRGKQVDRRVGPKRKPGTRDGLTEAQANRKLADMIADSGAAPPPVTERLTIEQLGQQVLRLKRKEGRKRSTIEAYTTHLNVHLVPYFGDRAVTDITTEDIDAFVDELLDPTDPSKKGAAPKSVRNYLGTLHTLYEFAIGKQLATINPVVGATRPKSDADADAEIHFLTDAELDKLLDSMLWNRRGRGSGSDLREAGRQIRRMRAEGETWSRIALLLGVAESTAIYISRVDPDDFTMLAQLDHALVLTAAMTGLRMGELLALRWGDVDWEAGVLRVRRNYVRGEMGTPKSKRSSRAVPMADRVGQALEKLSGSHGIGPGNDRSLNAESLVFRHPVTGEPLDRSNLRRRYKVALRRAKVREVRFHDLRHTFGTRMAASGVPMRTLQEWMGHRDIKTTQVYADYQPRSDERELVNRAFGFGQQSQAGGEQSAPSPQLSPQNADKSGPDGPTQPQ